MLKNKHLNNTKNTYTYMKLQKIIAPNIAFSLKTPFMFIESLNNMAEQHSHTYILQEKKE